MGIDAAAVFPPPAIKALGAVEVLAGIGVIVPALVGSVPALVPLAAGGVTLIMVGAVVFHLCHRDFVGSAPAVVVLVAAVFVAWGRADLWMS